MIRSVPYGVRRVRQTLAGFDNGAQVLVAYARGRLTGRPEEVVFRTNGMSIVCPNVAGARVPVYEIQVEDTYRLAWFTAGFDAAPVVVDIGAHIGTFSLALTSMFPDAEVAAFEPAPTTFAFLQRNLAANKCTRVHAHQLAVSDHGGTIDFTDNGAGSVLNGITNPGGTSTTVGAVSLSDALAQAGPTVDLLKFDAEGAEYDAVLGTPVDALARVRRAVIEYHDVPGHSWVELREHLSAAGLEVVAQEEVTNRLGVAWLARDL